MDKTTILSNLRKAYEILEAVPKENYNLRVFYWESLNGCKTLACAAGWLALDEYFNKLGFKMDFKISAPTLKGEIIFTTSELDQMFGPNAYNLLFKERCKGLRDRIIVENEFPVKISNKELVLKRFEWQIAEVEATL